MRRIGLLSVGVLVGLVAGGGFVWAAVPEPGTGAVSACYATSGTSKGIVRVVDAQAGESCNAGENALRLQSTQCDGYPRTGLDWRGCDFHGAYLASQYLSGGRMNGTNFAFDNLTQAILAGTDFTGANLAGAQLSSADLTNAILRGANLTGAKLSPPTGCCPTAPPTRMTGVTGVTAPQLRLVTRVPHFGFGVKCPTNAVDLSHIVFGALNATGFNLLNFDFSSSSLIGANFTGANLTNTFLAGTDLTGANFTNANLTCANDMNSPFVSNAIWNNTTCPDGTNSDNNGGTCVGHL
jgi:uncharacterized protein YjbI with pentapeptide repeats